MEFFGFKFGSKAEEEQPQLKSVAMEPNDGSLVIQRRGSNEAIGGAFGWSTSFDLDPTIISEQALITKYREMSNNETIDKAINIIINEMISTSAEKVVSINLDRVEYSDKLKEIITEEFEYIINLLGFNEHAYEILRKWYIDGRMYYQVVIDKEKAKEIGIGKLTYIDPRKIKKVRVVDQSRDQRTGVDLYQEKKGYYIFSERGFLNTASNTDVGLNSTVSIAEDAIAEATSGLLDPTDSIVLSYLHKAIRPLNQLRGLEDATMIYKLSRAPERRIFYIDVGNLPPAKAEQVLQKQMNQYRSKSVYDVNTGSVRTDPKQMTMIEDYWLPRRSDGRATEITTLPSGNLSGEMGELDYFLNKLYNSLNVPVTRMDSSNGFSFGKTTEITRDEVSLTKFVERLRRRFNSFFLELLRRQLALKGILNHLEFDNIRSLITIDYESDNYFYEMLHLEVMEQRMNMLDRMINYTVGGSYNKPIWSMESIYKDILQMDDEEIKLMKEQVQEDMKNQKQIMKDLGLEDQPIEPTGPKTTQIVHNADNSARLANQTNKPINNTTDTLQSPGETTNVTTSND